MYLGVQLEDKRLVCLQELMKSDTYAFDLETTGLDPFSSSIKGLVLGTKKSAWYFKFHGTDKYPFIETMDLFKPLFLDLKKICVGQNLKFDIKFMLQSGYEMNNKFADTMVAAYLLDESRAASHGRLALKGKGGLIDECFDVLLETWAESELNLGAGKGKSEETYALDDVTWTMKLWQHLYPRLKKQKLEKAFWELCMPITPIMSKMELSGIAVNIPYLWGLKKNLQKELEDYENKIYSSAGGVKFNISSPKQLNAVLFGPATSEIPYTLNLPVKKFMVRTKQGLWPTNESILSIYASDGIEVCQAILDFRGQKKLLSTYVEPLITRATESHDSRIRSSFGQTSTVTGRWNSSNPNLQNLPRSGGIREAFVAPKGKVLVCADYGQLELRIMAHASGDKNMVSCYLNDEDIHDKTRVNLVIAEEDRAVAKGINFGLIYMMSPPTFKQTLWNQSRIIKTLDECKEWSYLFFQTYSGVKSYHTLIEQRINEYGFVQSICGRYRRLRECMKINYGNALRMAINFTIQGSAADIVSLAMRNLDREIRKRALTSKVWREVKFLIQVHDEILSECPEEIAEEYCALKSSVMTSVVKLKVPLVADAHIGNTWKDAK